MIKRIIFRGDSAANIGVGHVYRLIAIAYMVRGEYDCLFISHDFPEFLKQELAKLEIPFYNVPIIDYPSPDEKGKDDELAFDMEGVIGSNDIVITDGYWFGPGYQKAIKAAGSRLICIDDLHDQLFYADLIINHAPDVQESDYVAQSYTRFALGGDYAILRPSFLMQATCKRQNAIPESVFICFGGSDKKKLTQEVLKVARQYEVFKKLIVVTGPASIHWHMIDEYVASDDRIDHYHSVDEEKMLTLMKEADLAIVPASNMLMECLATGLKVIAGTYADNQTKLLKGYTNQGAVISAGSFAETDLRNAIDLALMPGALETAYFDGLSGKRIARRISELSLSLRKLQESDCRLLFEWANDLDTRQNAINTKTISWKDHVVWFDSKINSDDTKIFILEDNATPLGQVRYDLKEERWIISYSIDARFRGRGLGTQVIRLSLPYMKGYVVSAAVKPDNKPSIRVFESLNFQKKPDVAINNEVLYIYETYI